MNILQVGTIVFPGDFRLRYNRFPQKLAKWANGRVGGQNLVTWVGGEVGQPINWVDHPH